MNEALARQFAWLLRADLRSKYSGPTGQDFDQWWLLRGRQEYPGWATPLSTSQIDALFADAGAATLAGVELQIPKVVSMLASFRPDAVKELSRGGQLQGDLFFAWAVIKGLSEHHLLAHVPQRFLATLDRPLPATLENASESAPAATLLMYLVWSLMDDKTKTTYNLMTAEGRPLFLQWFFSVVQPLGIAPLVAGRWRAWLLAQKNEVDWAWLKRSPTKPTAPTHTPLLAAAPKPFGVNLYGFAFGELGIGEDLRMAVACCEAAHIPYHVVNVKAGADLRQGDTHLEGQASELHADTLPPYSTNIFCLPAFDMVSRVFMQKGAAVFEGYRNIGWWPWEMAVFPKSWAPYAFGLVDEVWASSQFLFKMYQAATVKPVRLMPLAASVGRAQSFSRAHFGLPEQTFLFLFVFDFNSSTARKNPQAVLDAFKLAFTTQDTRVALAIKVMNGKDDNPDWLAFLRQCQADQRIHLITTTLDRPEVLGLIAVCDAYVSLHRAEGFGRTLAEAMLFGKPVVATHYSGNADFMAPEVSFAVKYNLVPVPEGAYQWVEPADGATWADVDTRDAAEQMKRARAQASPKLSAQIKSFALQQFDPQKLGPKLSEALNSPK
jgi:glycosyltransferase involved in cell wall biosynthesis